MLINETAQVAYLVHTGDPSTKGFLLPQNVPITLTKDAPFDVTDGYNVMHTGTACTIDIIETLDD